MSASLKGTTFLRRIQGRSYNDSWRLTTLGTGWTRGIAWGDMEVRNDFGGKPKVLLGGGAREICAQQGIAQILISISHCRTHATAYALALGSGDSGVMGLRD